MSIAGHLIVIGNRTWDRLPKDIQDIVLEESAKAQEAYLPFLDKVEGDAIKEIEAAGGVFKPFQPAEMAKWKEATPDLLQRSEEHTYELQSLMRISYAVFCLQKKMRKQMLI